MGRGYSSTVSTISANFVSLASTSEPQARRCPRPLRVQRLRLRQLRGLAVRGLSAGGPGTPAISPTASSIGENTIGTSSSMFVVIHGVLKLPLKADEFFDRCMRIHCAPAFSTRESRTGGTPSTPRSVLPTCGVVGDSPRRRWLV
jgi:hypothetical protein